MICVLQTEFRSEVEALLEWLRMRNFCNCARLRLLAS
jgi:hypothetical protein